MDVDLFTKRYPKSFFCNSFISIQNDQRIRFKLIVSTKKKKERPTCSLTRFVFFLFATISRQLVTNQSERRDGCRSKTSSWNATNSGFSFFPFLFFSFFFTFFQAHCRSGTSRLSRGGKSGKKNTERNQSAPRNSVRRKKNSVHAQQFKKKELGWGAELSHPTTDGGCFRRRFISFRIIFHVFSGRYYSPSRCMCVYMRV